MRTFDINQNFLVDRAFLIGGVGGCAVALTQPLLFQSKSADCPVISDLINHRRASLWEPKHSAPMPRPWLTGSVNARPQIRQAG
jgi:hypothetical protein